MQKSASLNHERASDWAGCKHADLIAVGIYVKYSVGRSIRPIRTRCWVAGAPFADPPLWVTAYDQSGGLDLFQLYSLVSGGAWSAKGEWGLLPPSRLSLSLASLLSKLNARLSHRDAVLRPPRVGHRVS